VGGKSKALFFVQKQENQANRRPVCLVFTGVFKKILRYLTETSILRRNKKYFPVESKEKVFRYEK